MQKLLFPALICFQLASAIAAGSDALLVENGQPRAEIVIAERPQRTTRLAAAELQSSIEKISGARLRIVHTPSGRVPVSIYVGRSPHTDRLGVTPAGLEHGAYRMISGPDRLVLIGDDSDFTPVEPWARNNGEIVSGKLQREWNAITGAEWGVPNRGMYKERLKLPGDLGLPTSAEPPEELQPLVVWDYDQRGSFNAVCGFLRHLGVRWYLPGELGEVVPTRKTIPLPRIDEIAEPDFPIRRFCFRLSVVGRETALWSMRLGLRDPSDIQTAHGLAHMTRGERVFAAHPDWFALYGGRRDYDRRSSKNQLCLSNPGLFQETVRWVRAQFDHYGTHAVSVMPPDGYTAICQCPLCEGKDTPERGERGRLSDYVWNFVNRVAGELRKTHPDKRVLNCAYGIYTLPPLQIDRLEPNVLVSIVGGRRPVRNDPQRQEELRQLREAWVKKTDNPIIIFENYPFTGRGWYLPAFTPHSLGESVNATKGISQGEDIWLSVGRDFDTAHIGFNHFLVYFTARMYWGGPEADVDALFREYCRLFYGPAEQEMHAFFEYCENHWQEMEKDKARADRALELFAAARDSADADSVYGRRIALIDDYLKGLRTKSRQLGQPRGPVPKLRLVGSPRGEIVVDGKLDDEPWVNCPVASTGRLRELQTGRQPIFGTTCKTAWIGGDLYFAIRCDERAGDGSGIVPEQLARTDLNIATTRKQDPAIWYGDAIEILLETESHSYYQIAVNPAGALIDLDRGAPRDAWFGWDSQAEVAAQIAPDHWTVELRIPVTQDENDPLNQVIGRKPTQSLPWHINICRQRIRENGAEYSAFSPTGTRGFHEPMKFAHFYHGRSHTFEADPSVTDFLIASRAAEELQRQQKHEQALEAFVALAEGDATELQESTALAQAAASARAIGDWGRAAQLVERIPLRPVADTVQMHNLLAQGKASDLIAEFADEDIAAWPFWQAGAGYLLRGRGYALTAAGEQAEADLTRALAWTSDPRTRRSILLAIGDNRERRLKDPAAALQAYRMIVEAAEPIGAADEFRAVQGMVRVLTLRRDYDEALAVLRRLDIDRLQGYWRGAMRLALGDTLSAAGHKQQAVAEYRKVLSDRSAIPQQRDAAEQAITSLQQPEKP